MVVKKGLLQAPGIFRLVAGARMRKGFFQTGCPFSCHSLKHRPADSGYLEMCCWLWACGLLARWLHITIYTPGCQGGARNKEEAGERTPPGTAHI